MFFSGQIVHYKNEIKKNGKEDTQMILFAVSVLVDKLSTFIFRPRRKHTPKYHRADSADMHTALQSYACLFVHRP